MASKLAVVTGGSGFIGQHVATELLARGYDVRILDVNPPPQSLRDRVDFCEGSILDARSVDAALKGANLLFHMAANPNLWAKDKTELMRTNFVGTKSVLGAATSSSLDRIVFTSTETVLKGYRDRSMRMVDENSPLPDLADLPGQYSRSKLLADLAAREAAEAGLPVTLVYPTIPIGAGDTSFTPPTKMLQGFLNGTTPAYLDCELNMIAVSDLAQGHVLAAEKGRIGERYILAGENIRLGALLNLLEEISDRKMPKRRVPYWLSYGVGLITEWVSDNVTGTPPIAPLEGVRVAGMPLSFDNRRAVEELGLKLTPLRDALKESVSWLEQNGHLKQ
jgi:dihydroflavonol-4-reductase